MIQKPPAGLVNKIMEAIEKSSQNDMRVEPSVENIRKAIVELGAQKHGWHDSKWDHGQEPPTHLDSIIKMINIPAE